MKKRIIGAALAVLILTALIPLSVFATDTTVEIDSVAVAIAPPTVGSDTYKETPQITMTSGHCTVEAVSWLSDLSTYSSETPYLVFENGSTYYVYVVLKADEGYGFKKSGSTASGVDDGFDYFDGCTVTGGDLAFAASRYYDYDYFKGDYLRLKIAVKAQIKRVDSVSAVFTPPAPGVFAEEVSPESCIALPDGAPYAVVESGWNEKVFDDLFQPFTGVFEAGVTYYLNICFESAAGYVFNQGGPYGYTSVSITGGAPLYDILSVTNMMDSDDKIHSYGTVMVAFTPSAGLAGDVNGDGSVDMKDVLLMRRAIAGLVTLTPEEEARGDVIADETADMKDVLKLRRIIAGLKD